MKVVLKSNTLGKYLSKYSLDSGISFDGLTKKDAIKFGLDKVADVIVWVTVIVGNDLDLRLEVI